MDAETVQITESDLQQLVTRLTESGAPQTVETMTEWIVEIMARRVVSGGEG